MKRKVTLEIRDSGQTCGWLVAADADTMVLNVVFLLLTIPPFDLTILWKVPLTWMITIQMAVKETQVLTSFYFIPTSFY